MLPQFDTSTFSSQLFWLLISLGIVIFGIYYFVIPKYNQILDKRLSSIKNEVNTALYLQKEVIKLKKNRLQRIAEAETSAKEMVKIASQNIMDNQTNQLQKIKKEYEDKFAKFEQSIDSQKNVIINNIEPFVENSIDEIVDKFIAAELLRKNGT